MGGPGTTAVLLLATGAVAFGGVTVRAVLRRRRKRGDAAADPERGLDADVAERELQLDSSDRPAGRHVG